MSRPHPVLVATLLAALGAALTLTLTPLGADLGFVPLPWPVRGACLGLTVAYLAFAEALNPTPQVAPRTAAQAVPGWS